jgi:tRNA (guanine10-N2)-dimethyltransferase
MTTHQSESYIFELSGEHEALPRAEVLACLEAQDAEYELEYGDKGILSIKGENIDISHLQKRLALTHGIDLEFLTCRVNELVDTEHELEIGKGTFAVRARRIQSQHEELNLKALEKQVADLVKGGNQVDLENPEIEIRVIISGRCFIGKRLAGIDRSAFEERKVQNRPYFSPVSLHPRLARALVNLSRVKEGQSLLDPFCGTGGVLMEASIVGAQPIGSDIDSRMVEGCEENLGSLGIHNIHLFKSDISDVKKEVEHVDAIATDPPYGKAATTNKEELSSLYNRAFNMFSEVLGEGGYAAVALPDTRSIQIGEEFLALEESYAMKVHRSLTRHFCVYRKE